MTFRVLQTSADNKTARDRLQARGLGYWPRLAPPGWFATMLGAAPIAIGDFNKSWDVLLTVEEIERSVRPGELVVDLGAFASEVPCALAKAGYTNLVGIDLNPSIRRMPFRNRVQWRCGDMTATGIPAGTVAAAVAISSIEHGDPTPVLREAARLLRPGGLFIGSTDYWPDKVDTTDIQLFSLPWKIFSAAEIRQFFNDARLFGLTATGSIETTAQEQCIDYADRLYTMGWFVFRKAPTPTVPSDMGPHARR